MKNQVLSMALLLLAVPAQAASVTDPDAPRSLPVSGPVSVSWSDPAQFSELRHSRNRWESRQGNWVMQLAQHLRQEVEKALPPGQRMEFVITDLKRAGDYEPWHGSDSQDIRIVRDIYPPRVSFHFVRYGDDGLILDQGQRKLVDMGFLAAGSSVLGGDPLRHEKRMLDHWIRREIRTGPDVGLR